MKAMNTIIKTGLVLILAAACSRQGYYPYNQYTPGDTSTTTEDEDTTPVFDYDFVYERDGIPTGQSILYFKRTMANFYFYNTSYWTYEGYQYGVTDESDLEEVKVRLDSYDQNYWSFNTIKDLNPYSIPELGLKVPAPMDIGDPDSVKIVLSFNLDERREIETDQARLIVKVVTNEKTFNRGFYLKENIEVNETGEDTYEFTSLFGDDYCYNTTYGKVCASCTEIQVMGVLQDGQVTIYNVLHRNTRNSYKDPNCYLYSSMPSSVKNLKLPSGVPSRNVRTYTDSNNKVWNRIMFDITATRTEFSSVH